MSESSVLPLGDENVGNVYLRDALNTPRGPAVSWVSLPQIPSATRRYGAALLLDGKVASFLDTASPDDIVPVPPSLFERPGEIGLVAPRSFDAVRIPLDTFVPGVFQTLPIATPVLSQPALLGVGQAVAALVDPGPQLVFFDSGLSERLVEHSLGSESHGPMLTPTCNGLVATWSSGVQHAAAFDTFGKPASAVESPELAPYYSPLATSLWDGAAVVLKGNDAVVELDNVARTISRTPVQGVSAAIGTDDGILAVRFVDDQQELVLVERTSGTTLDAWYVENAYLGETVITATNRYVYVVGTGGFNDSAIHWLTIECSE